MKKWALAASIAAVACAAPAPRQDLAAGYDIVIYPAQAVITMTGEGGMADAVAVSADRIVATGSLAELRRDLPTANVNPVFEDQVIVPGLIDPHIHVVLGSLQYNLPITPPWPMATPHGMKAGLPNRAAYLVALSDLVEAAGPNEPIVAYGYHNLVHGDLHRADLDAIAPDQPLIVWHYSSHDFYLNSAAIEAAGFTPEMAQRFHGVDLDADGALTGRIYEDAAMLVVQAFAGVILTPEKRNGRLQRVLVHAAPGRCHDNGRTRLRHVRLGDGGRKHSRQLGQPATGRLSSLSDPGNIARSSGRSGTTRFRPCWTWQMGSPKRQRRFCRA